MQTGLLWGAYMECGVGAFVRQLWKDHRQVIVLVVQATAGSKRNPGGSCFRWFTSMPNRKTKKTVAWHLEEPFSCVSA